MRSLLSASIILALSACQAKEPTAAPVKAEKGKTAAVDGIEITFGAARVGKLPKAGPRNGLTYKVPDTDFLIVDVALKNVTEAKIISLDWIWKQTRLKDEHGNFYRAEDLTSAFGVAQRIEGKLKPNQEIKGIIVFEVPLENAKEITLISDPGFWRDNGDGTIHELSDSEVHFQFPNPAAKPATP